LDGRNPLLALPLTLGEIYRIIRFKPSRAQESEVGRKKASVCRNCGYDLRATPERCPEYGRIAEETP
jgi:hypothetical protein